MRTPRSRPNSSIGSCRSARITCCRSSAGAHPADAVARFHLRNGARLERINWLGDVSPIGMRRAAGMMVNYLYRSTNPQRSYDASSATRIAQVSREVARLGREASVLFRG